MPTPTKINVTEFISDGWEDNGQEYVPHSTFYMYLLNRSNDDPILINRNALLAFQAEPELFDVTHEVIDTTTN